MDLLTTVVYQTVTNRPRTWSSHTNISSRNERLFGKSMNSVEELPTYNLHYFRGNNSYKTAATTYDFPEHTPPPKKDRKWSFGNLFRRRKKDDSDSSSEDESSHKKYFLNRKKKGDKRKKTKPLGGAFDHIVTPPGSHNPRQSNSLQNGVGIYRLGASFDDGAVLSDPSGCFGIPLPKPPSGDQPDQHRSQNSLGSVDSLSKKSRKERTKARAVARRDSFNRHSSSEEEDSQRSCSSSKFRSDESLSKRDISGGRRSRNSRTERYIRRLSKDDESILNREAMQRQARENWQIRVRDDYSPTAVNYGPSSRPAVGTPPQYRYSNHHNSHFAYNHPDDAQSQRYSGLFTIPPSHSNIKYRNSNSHHAFDELNGSRLSMNQQSSVQPNSSSNCFNIRSLSCDSNIHKSPSPDDMRPAQRDARHRNLSLVEQPRLKQPPPPPPRDPRRILQNVNHVDSRPSHLWHPITTQTRRSQFGGYRTNSEDVIPTFTDRPNHIIRPASVTNETKKKYQGSSLSSLVQQDPEKFKYMTEKRARSRKPIFIQSTDRINSNNYNSSPTSLNWKLQSQQPSASTPAERQSPQIFTAQTHVQTKIFLPSTLCDNSKSVDVVDCARDVRRQNNNIYRQDIPHVLQHDNPVVHLQDNSHVHRRDCSSYVHRKDTSQQVQRQESPHILRQNSPHALRQNSPHLMRQNSNSPFKPISPTNVSIDMQENDDEPIEVNRRKSANLEEALDELEAIYKSLHLGDEDLLERAEQREMSIAAQKLLDTRNETYSGSSRGAMSDSSFSYEPFSALDIPKKKVLKKAHTLDRKNDDMALRKMKDTGKTTSIVNSLANVSYLLASPVHFESSPISNDEVDGETAKEDSTEPDITYDDVVYRIVKHANNTLKVADPQPPFGIPVGPVTLAANSDYLHAVPENTYLPYKNNKIPDIVKDDLAYRNLRKDANKEPALKPVSPIDFENTNIKDTKKKRAVRSLSANISNIINMEPPGGKKVLRRDTDCENEFKKTKLTDIADAMEIARQILKEKENRIQATKRAFLSDSETKYRRDVTSASSTETITESRLNFLNEMRSLDVGKSPECQSKGKYLGDNFLHSKPPRGATPDRRYTSKEKESTPTPHSPTLSRKDSLNSSFEELLTALAVEARETSDRITNDLNTLDDNLRRKEGAKKQLDEIEAVSEHAKLCEKLLECVVESTELIASTKVESALEEEVQNIESLIPKSVANIVTTRVDVVEAAVNPVDVEVHSASEQDYDNLISSEVDESTTPSKSPFEEHRAELIASFQEMKQTDDDDDDDSAGLVNPKMKEGGRIKKRTRRRRLQQSQTPVAVDPCDGFKMSKLEGTSEDRIARYKEERRRQLREQFNQRGKDAVGGGSSSSGAEAPRTTRAYRLRVAAASAANALDTTSQCSGSSKELQNTSISRDSTNLRGNLNYEKDKSSKRKSNLNRSMTCEEVQPPPDSDEQHRGIRRRRRLNTSGRSNSRQDDRLISDTSLTATNLSPLSSPISTAINTAPRKRSDLSIHMDNARKGVIPSCSEMGKHTKSRLITSSPVERSSSSSDNNKRATSNKENVKIRAKTDDTAAGIRRDLKTKVPSSSITDNKEKTKTSSSSKASSRISRRLDELTALTRETLALASSNHQPSKPISNRTKPMETSTNHRESAPVSILKRKVSQEEAKWVASTPPVTFSPNVIEPAQTNRKQGILKKRRSLDESQVLRHRSCSPDSKIDSHCTGSILKTQRRSSLEEITRLPADIHGILKRKTPKQEEELDNSLNSPQGILKRRSGASSAGSVHNVQHHVSIATAVILAAAEGAEMVLDPETVRPILKKKSFSEENDDLKPILKKKSSTETDENEDKPKRPILKHRFSKDYDKDYHSANDSGSECDVKPILKSSNKEEAPVSRPRLSFCEDRYEDEDDASKKWHIRRLQHEQLQLNGTRQQENDNERSEQMRVRNVSVSELVMSFENSGAIPKKSNLKRNSDRCRTQPVTVNEFEASLNYVRSPRTEAFHLSTGTNSTNNVHSLLDLSSSALENDISLLPTTMPNDNDTTSGKMSSDSAFQSLGDGLELDENSVLKSPKKIEPSNLAMQMKAIALEAKNLKLSNLKSSSSKYRSSTSSSPRFATQPITSAEVDQASKLKRNDEESVIDIDPSNLSLSERVQLFNTTGSSKSSQPGNFLSVPKRRTRFNTQPVTTEEINSATHSQFQSIIHSFNCLSTLDVSDISPVPNRKPDIRITKSPPPLSPTSLKTSSRTETLDEGISSNESDSENNESHEHDKQKMELSPSRNSRNIDTRRSSSENTSDESSGGREIQRIIGAEVKYKLGTKTQRHNEYNVQKSRSNTAVGDETREDILFRTPRTPPPPLRGIQKSSTTAAMQSTISELRAKLQHNGDSEWRKRTSKLNNTPEELNLLKVKNLFNVCVDTSEDLSEKSILKIRKDELDASSKQWRSRVEKSDAENFSVAGRMQTDDVPLNIVTPDKVRRTPSYKRFKGKDANSGSDSSSTPVSPDNKLTSTFTRSNSSPASNDSSENLSPPVPENGRKVRVLMPNDDTFKSFFRSVETKLLDEHVDVNLDDFDTVPVHALLVQKKNIQVQKRRGASKNPLKALAARDDIQNEYTEVITGFAEREAKRLNIEKLAKNSHLSVEALAGLASKEDIKSVALKKTSTASTGLYLPFKNKMLIQIKGRRHVQTRLVEPVAASINEGDNFILVTPNALYNYIGSYSNVIEQSRASDIINHIQQSGDMGCKVDKVITINAKKGLVTKEIDEFWSQLGADNRVEITKAGHPDEDEVYESSMIDTNMIYTLENNELIPVEKYWSTMPKIEMLEPSRVFVFDFGSEMYVWSGKNADPDVKKTSLKLAKELWENGYNYSECLVCPINVAEMLGARASVQKDLMASSRPEWALFAKVTQHRETVLFREKFLDWPDYTRVIKVKEIDKTDDKSASDPIMEQIKPCDVKALLSSQHPEPDYEIEGSHLGRGRSYFDEESRRHYEINTLDITVWSILENTYEKIDVIDHGHFYDSDTYIIRWQFRVSVTGRELSGKPSKHLQLGRDRCVYFTWLGEHATINEKGTTALLTVELDSEHAKQIRITQGSEPPVFLQLFNGKMFIHNGKSDDEKTKQKLYVVRGEIENETSLVEVPVSTRSLRSRTSFLYVESKQVMVWHGAKSTDQIKAVTKQLGEHVSKENADRFNLSKDLDLGIFEEGKDDAEFLNRLGEKPQLYYSLRQIGDVYDKTPRLFKFSSITGKFEATEVLCPHRSNHVTPYPFLQSDLYSANQPALFLFDNEHELWLWQGWWPEKENDVESPEVTGSGPVRWQAERRAAMQTAMDYWHQKHPTVSTTPAYLVWAGLEPLQFSNLFPMWRDRDDVAELNIRRGIAGGDAIPIEKELAMLTRTTYPLAELLQRPLPIGVDPTQLEIYLSPDDFRDLLHMSKEDFHQLPMWKQTTLKKDKGLF